MKQVWVVSAKGRYDGLKYEGIVPVAVFTKRKDAERCGNDMYKKYGSSFITPLVLNTEKDNLGGW